MLTRAHPSAALSAGGRMPRSRALLSRRPLRATSGSDDATTTTTTTTTTTQSNEDKNGTNGTKPETLAAAKPSSSTNNSDDDSWFSRLLRFGGGNNDDDNNNDDDETDNDETDPTRDKTTPPAEWRSFSVAKDVPAGALDNLVAYHQPDPQDVQRALGKLRSLALPWRRFQEGSFLAFKLEGDIPDSLQAAPTPWPSPGPPSIPQICEALEKAAYDPRVAGIAVEIGPLAIGWARLRELARHIELFRASGKPCVAFLKLAGEKEYALASSFAEIFAPPSASLRLNGFAVSGTFLRGALDKVGIDPQVRRIGAYKSAGDQLDRRDMSGAQREALTALVEGVYGGFCSEVARNRNAAREVRQGATLYEPYERLVAKAAGEAGEIKEEEGATTAATTPTTTTTPKTLDDVRALLDEGVLDNERLLEQGWLDGLLYEDQLIDLLKLRSRQAVERLAGGSASAAAAAKRKARKQAAKKEKAGLDTLPRVGLRKYSRVGRGALSFALAPIRGGSKKQPRISVLRAGGAITQGGGSGGGGGGNGITPGALIPKLRALARDPATAAVVLRVDSPGGDALASDLMWREVRRLNARKPVIAAMGDVAASGGYYLSMGAAAVVANELTVTGSIGVVTAKPSLGGVYERTGVTKEIVSRGRYAQLLAADNRSFTEDERALFDKGAERAYAEFRDKAAESRGMKREEMERWAQGRVWLGDAALERGLVDAIGGVREAARLAEIAAGLYEEDEKEEGEKDKKDKKKKKRGPTPVVEVSVVRPSALALLSGGGGGGSAAARGALALASLAAAVLGGGAGGAAALMMMGGLAASASSAAAASAVVPAVGAGLAAAAATGAPMAVLAGGEGGEVSAVGSDLAMAQVSAGGNGGGLLLGGFRGGGGGAMAAADCDAFLDESGGGGGGAASSASSSPVALLERLALSIDEAVAMMTI
jgi:protease-4